MESFWLHNALIVNNNKEFIGSIYIASGKIKELIQTDSMHFDKIVLPGFIDSHIHGAYGLDTMDLTSDNLLKIGKKIASEGVTGFLPTTMTVSKEDLLKSLKHLSSQMQYSGIGAKPLGIHLEGPFISEKQIGAQRKDAIQKPNIELFELMNQTSHKNIKKVTLAPEVEGASKLIEYLNDQGIIVSLGHTNATQSETKRASALGATSLTHFFNAMRPFHHREIGIIGEGLMNPALKAEIIADFIHVSPDAIKLLFKNKSPNEIILITDAMRAKGLQDGTYDLGGQTVFVKGNHATLKDGTLAGSVLNYFDGVINLKSLLDLSLQDIVKLTSYNILTQLKLIDKMGIIEPGYPADLVVLNQKFQLIDTFVDGKKQ